MPNDANKPATGQGSPPVITKEVAKQLAAEGEALRREYRRRLDAAWNISKEQWQTRTR